MLVKNFYTKETFDLPETPNTNYFWRITKDRIGYILELRKKTIKYKFFNSSILIDQNPVRGDKEGEFVKIAQLILDNKAKTGTFKIPFNLYY